MPKGLLSSRPGLRYPLRCAMTLRRIGRSNVSASSCRPAVTALHHGTVKRSVLARLAPASSCVLNPPEPALSVGVENATLSLLLCYAAALATATSSQMFRGLGCLGVVRRGALAWARAAADQSFGGFRVVPFSQSSWGPDPTRMGPHTGSGRGA